MGIRLCIIFAILMLSNNFLNLQVTTTNEGKTIEDTFEDLGEKFVQIVERMLSIIKAVVAQVARISYATVGMVGVLLYYSRVNKKIGMDLIKGAIILAVIAEVVFPFLI